ncbi:ribbon-helix-helix domain-containing protein [Rhizobium ruizarguesonis]
MGRPRGNRYPVRLSVSVEAADHAALSKLAADLNLSAAWLVRRAVTEFVERNCGNEQPELPLVKAASKKE